MKKLDGKIALVTGSTRGLGKSIAIEFASQGATVLLHGSKPSSHTEEVKQFIQTLPPTSRIFYAKVEDKNEVENMVKAIQQKYPRLDILVNNAGIARSASLLAMKDEDWDAVLKVNLYGTYYVTKAFLPHLLKSPSGRIISMSSIQGVTGEYGLTNYSASKAAIIGFTKSLAKEVGKYKITVNAICPGFTDVGLINDVPKKRLEQHLNTIPLKRLAKNEEVAKLAAFLASNDASYISGQAIHINGGMY